MNGKSLLLFSIVAIAILEAFANRDRPARDYSEPLPVSAVIDRNNANNRTSIAFVEPQRVIGDRPPREYSEPLPESIDRISRNRTSIRNSTVVQTPRGLSEPLGCSKCLDAKYFIHYYQRGCKPISGHLVCRKPCPEYFECPDKEDIVRGCEYKGKVYKIGEKVAMDNPCAKGCFCSEGFSRNQNRPSKPTIECAHVDCFNTFKENTPNCYNIYVADQCCPKEICLNETQTQIKCAFGGKEYRLGQTIHQDIDPCVECKCNEQWDQNNGLNNTNCKRRSCDLEANRKFRDGCLPIYNEKTCCPIDYYCPPAEELYCKFGDKKYMIGEKLDIDYARTECKCVVPPDFTCIQKAYKERTPEVFIPKVFVDLKDKTEDNLSVTPSPKPQSCPPFVEGGLACAGVNCTTIIGPDGCQHCKCEKPCPLFKCRSNCILTATTPGVCPVCRCD